MLRASALVVTSILLGSCSSIRMERQIEPSPDAVPVPGTRVRLAPPAGHVPGPTFRGYEWPGTSTSLSIHEAREIVGHVLAEFDASRLREHGATLVDQARATFGEYKGRLLRVRFDQRGVPMERWIAVVGTLDRTAVLFASYAEQDADLWRDTMKATLLGATWNPAVDFDPLESLPWTVEPPGGLVFAEVVETTVVFAEDEDLRSADPADAWTLVRPVRRHAENADLRTFAEAAVRKFEMERLDVDQTAPIEIGGRAGWEILARCKETTTEAEVILGLYRKPKPESLLHQIVLVDAEQYVQITSKCTIDSREAWLPRFRACAASWKPRPDPRLEWK